MSQDNMFIEEGYRKQFQQWLTEVRIIVYILVIIFAMASWIDINGLWTQVPLLVNEVPEGWNLPSYLIIIIQIANIGPLIYTLLNRVAPNRVKEWPVVYVIIIVGVVACFFLIFFWSETSYIFGQERSTALLILSFFLAMVDTTSSVVFLPYMANFKVHYMTAFYIGEGFSGLLPAIVGLIQGVGSDPDCRNVSSITHNETTGQNVTEYNIVPFYDEPLFSVEIFFLFLFCMLLLSGVAFTFLNFSSYCQHEMISHQVNPKDAYIYDNKAWMGEPVEETALNNGNAPKVYNSEDSSKNNGQDFTRNKVETPHITHITVTKKEDDIVPVNLDEIGMDKQFTNLNRYQFLYLFLTSAMINGLGNGVLPSTGSYSALPYGNRAYNLSTRLGMVANPLACFFALFIPCKSLIILSCITLLGITGAGYQLYLADMSPYPPLQDEVLGEILVISSSVLMVGLFSYSKVTIASMMRDDSGRKGLLWCGVSQQVGSFTGAIIIFIFVNIIKTFKDMPTCGFI